MSRRSLGIKRKVFQFMRKHGKKAAGEVHARICNFGSEARAAKQLATIKEAGAA